MSADRDPSPVLTRVLGRGSPGDDGGTSDRRKRGFVAGVDVRTGQRRAWAGGRALLAGLTVTVLLVPVAVIPAASADDHEGGGEPQAAFWKRVGHDAWHGLTRHDLHDVHFPPGEGGGECADPGFAVGAEGTVLKTCDGAETWEVRRYDVGDLHAVEFVDSRRGFAVGAEGTILRTDDGGESWVALFSGVDQDLYGVDFLDADRGFVAGSSPDATVLLRTVDGGDTWTARPITVDRGINEVLDVDFVDEEVGYAVGSREHSTDLVRVVRTEDGGATWDWMLSRGNSGRMSGVDVASPADEVAYAVGRPNYIWRTTGGESGWSNASPLTTAALGDFVDFRDVAFTDARRGYVVGAYSDPETDTVRTPVIVRTEDGFDTPPVFEPVDGLLSNGDAVRLEAVDATADGVAVAVGTSGVIVKRSTDPAELPQDPDGLCVPPEVAAALEGAAGDDAVCQEPADPEAESVPEAGQPTGPPPAFPQTTTSCAIPQDEVNKAFPCRAEFEFVREDGTPLGADLGPPRLLLDPGLRRVVGYHLSGGQNQGLGPRVFLYDVDRLEQRGVPGFGDPFAGASGRGDDTGVVNLRHSADFQDVARLGTTEGTFALDAERHRVFIGNNPTGAIEPVTRPRIAAVSLTGEFEPTLIEFEDLLAGVPPRVLAHTSLSLLAVDDAHNRLYAVTDGPLLPVDGLLGTVGSIGLQNQGVTLHAFAPSVDDQGKLALERVWHLALEDRCERTKPPDHFQFMGVSHDGRTIVLPCTEVSFTYFGLAPTKPAQVLNVLLPDGVAPEEVGEDDVAEFEFRSDPMPGSTAGIPPVLVKGAPGMEVLHWRTGERHFFWHYGRQEWIGGITIERGAGRGELVASDPVNRRLYLTGGDISGGTDGETGDLGFVQTVNTPADLTHPHVPTGSTRDLSGGVFDPETGRLFALGATESGDRVLTFEDRIGPTLPKGLSDPDAFTNDIDEAEANSISRSAESSAYGARVWWTGLQGALPGSYVFNPKGDLQSQTDPASEPPGYTYGALFRQMTLGPFLSRLPWRPHDHYREVFAAHVAEARLAGGFDADLASARARGLSIDDGTRDDGTTRIGAEQAQESAEAEGHAACGDWESPTLKPFLPPQEFKEPCQEEWTSGWEDFREGSGENREEFERCTLEGHDRLLREFDGRREVRSSDHDDECFSRFDEGDPGRNGETGEYERSSLEGRFGWTRPSQCADPGSEGDDTGADGSVTRCDAGGWQTEATARNSFVFDLPGAGGGAGSIDVGSSRSATRLRLDEERGMVTEGLALASDVEVEIEGSGSLRIGEVATVGRSWAQGRPGTAGSEFEVRYQDVVVAHEDGSVAFSCSPANSDTVARSEPEESEEEPGEAGCDPEAITEAVGRVFGDTMSARAPERDLQEATTGSPKGARAMVRRNRSDFSADLVLFNVTRDEVPGLQLLINADGTKFNRFRVDLAAVFAESLYQIGQPRVDPPPGSLAVELHDHTGAPLAGGRFEVAAVESGTVSECRTASDGVGSCRFGTLDAGEYQVRQVSAPSGFARQEGAVSVFVSPGSESVARFVNAPDAGGVEVTLVDPGGQPLAGGTFALTHEAGSPVSCTTGPAGACVFDPAPLGRYQLVQTAAPPGYEAADGMDFALTRPGQVARIQVVNGAAVAGASIEIIEIIEGSEPTASTQEPGGGPLRSFVDALADAFGFLLRNPLQALLFLMLFGVLAAPFYSLARRMDLIAAEEAT